VRTFFPKLCGQSCALGTGCAGKPLISEEDSFSLDVALDVPLPLWQNYLNSYDRRGATVAELLREITRRNPALQLGSGGNSNIDFSCLMR